MSQILGFTISRGVSPNNVAAAFEAEDRALSCFQHLERSSLEIGGTTLHLWGRDSISNCLHILPDGSTLALIGAIVAEFFGTPIVGMGFRISTEVGRMSLDMVWAEILVAAIAGSAFYGVLALLERAVTFWHPSFRRS